MNVGFNNTITFLTILSKSMSSVNHSLQQREYIKAKIIMIAG